MEKQDLWDAVKAVPTAAFTGAWYLNISFGQFITVIGGLYTIIVAVEKFAKVASWIWRKLHKVKDPPSPPEG